MLHADPEVPQALRIAAVPAAHPYVQNLIDPELAPSPDAVTLLADPQPAGAAPGQWWPPVMLDAAWISANADAFDVLHLHFGTESFTLEQLQGVVDALRRAGRPLVFTLHDLTNPQLVDQRAHLAQLDLLVPAADEVITLTPGAAREVRERWGREATVVAHPRVVSADALADAAPDDRVAALPDAAPDAPAAATPMVIGMHLRDLRPNIDALTAVDTLLAAVATLRDTGLDLAVIVDLNDRVRNEITRAELRARLEGVPFAVLREHPRFTDSELHASVLGTDVSVMPYGHGTHSGWLELCWDLGVAVAAPALGFYAEQHPGMGEVAIFERGSSVSLMRALLELLQSEGPAETPTGPAETPTGPAATPIGPGETSIRPAENPLARRARLRLEHAVARDAQQRDIHLAHLAVYRRALARARV